MSQAFSLIAITLVFGFNIYAATEISDSEGTEYLPVGTLLVANQDLLIRANTASFSLCRSEFLYGNEDMHLPKGVYQVCTEDSNELAGFCLFRFRPSRVARVLPAGSSWSIGLVRKHGTCSNCTESTEQLSIQLYNALGEYETVGMECRIRNGRDSFAPTVGELKTLLSGYLDVVQPEPHKVPVCQ